MGQIDTIFFRTNRDLLSVDDILIDEGENVQVKSEIKKVMLDLFTNTN